MRQVRVRGVVASAAAVMVMTGCGEEEQVRDASTPITAAAAAMACANETDTVGQQDPQPNPDEALTAWAEAAGKSRGIEVRDLVKSVEQVGRVLYVDEAESGVAAAVVAGRVTESAGNGWVVLSWARCTG